jgi:hypothetical protein
MMKYRHEEHGPRGEATFVLLMVTVFMLLFAIGFLSTYVLVRCLLDAGGMP